MRAMGRRGAGRGKTARTAVRDPAAPRPSARGAGSARPRPRRTGSGSGSASSPTWRPGAGFARTALVVAPTRGASFVVAPTRGASFVVAPTRGASRAGRAGRSAAAGLAAGAPEQAIHQRRPAKGAGPLARPARGPSAPGRPARGSPGRGRDRALRRPGAGASFDTASAETEVIRPRGPRRGLEARGARGPGPVDRFHDRRPPGPIGHVPPAKARARFHGQPKNTATAAQSAKRDRLPESRGGRAGGGAARVSWARRRYGSTRRRREGCAVGRAGSAADVLRRRDPGVPDDRGAVRPAASPDHRVRGGPASARGARSAGAGWLETVPGADARGSVALPRRAGAPEPPDRRHRRRGARRGRMARPQAWRGPAERLAQGASGDRRRDGGGPGRRGRAGDRHRSERACERRRRRRPPCCPTCPTRPPGPRRSAPSSPTAPTTCAAATTPSQGAASTLRPRRHPAPARGRRAAY